jgi:hypothetical protein
MGGRIAEGKKTYIADKPVCRVSIASQRTRIKETLCENQIRV